MTRVECFKTEEMINQPGKYVIRPVHENFNLVSTSGSFNVICARLMNLSYAEYLRFCRDVLGAEIIGKNQLYPIAVFNQMGLLLQFVRLLNARANLILWEKENPDWKQNQEMLAEYKKRKEQANVSNIK